MTLNRPCRVLVVEDNPADVRLLREAFKESDEPCEVHTVADGDEAIAFVYRRLGYGDKPRPDLILLDINLPKRSGHDVLAAVKNEPALWSIPVVMLTSSKSPEDVQSAYRHHANAYLQKPAELREYFNVVSVLRQFWLQMVELPAANA
jgi:CheY-like chemotaxis protein